MISKGIKSYLVTLYGFQVKYFSYDFEYFTRHLKLDVKTKVNVSQNNITVLNV